MVEASHLLTSNVELGTVESVLLSAVPVLHLYYRSNWLYFQELIYT